MLRIYVNTLVSWFHLLRPIKRQSHLGLLVSGSLSGAKSLHPQTGEVFLHLLALFESFVFGLILIDEVDGVLRDHLLNFTAPVAP